LAEQILSEHERLDVLVNNAGIGTGARTATERELSEDGYELRFAVMYLAPFLLTRLLEPLLVRSAPARIVNVASAGQAAIDFDDVMLERGYSGVQAYCQRKTALVILTFDLGELRDRGVTYFDRMRGEPCTFAGVRHRRIRRLRELSLELVGVPAARPR
jgi:NAD(P)-dependent dehydrogenase (short-subunit alcohol dehydrogenase family)